MNYAVSVKDVRRFLADPINRKCNRSLTWEEKIEQADTWSIDSDGDGKDDITKVDIDHNGIAEIAIVDEQGDGEVDYMLLDEDENGVDEIKIFGENSKYPGLWLIDEDEDGVWDQAAIDEDGDGELDRFESLK